jgi:hypothetical protein
MVLLTAGMHRFVGGRSTLDLHERISYLRY